MADEKKINDGEENELSEESEIYTLIDENGKECQFECVGKYEDGDIQYFAMLPVDEDEESDEYVILKLETYDDGEDVLVSVDDDEEFDKIAGIFDQMLFDEIDYDEE